MQSPTGDIIDHLSLGSKTEEGRFNSNFLLALLFKIVNEFYFILCTPIFISGRKPGAVIEKILASPTALPFHRALNQVCLGLMKSKEEGRFSMNYLFIHMHRDT